MMSGIFMGYKLHNGGKFSGDFYILRWEDAANYPHQSGLGERITAIRAQDVFPEKLADRFRFPIREGRLKLKYIDHIYTKADTTHRPSGTAAERERNSSSSTNV